MLKIPVKILLGLAGVTALVTGPVHDGVWNAGREIAAAPDAALGSINITRADEGVSTFANANDLSGATRTQLASFAPDMTFVAPDKLSTSAEIASVFVSDDLHVVAIASTPETCDYIVRTMMTRVRGSLALTCSAESVVAAWQRGEISPSA
jgi:hypothetical protein